MQHPICCFREELSGLQAGLLLQPCLPPDHQGLSPSPPRSQPSACPQGPGKPRRPGPGCRREAVWVRKFWDPRYPEGDLEGRWGAMGVGNGWGPCVFLLETSPGLCMGNWSSPQWSLKAEGGTWAVPHPCLLPEWGNQRPGSPSPLLTTQYRLCGSSGGFLPIWSLQPCLGWNLYPFYRCRN